MKNNILEEINRFNLLSNYNNKLTFSENLEKTETNLLVEQRSATKAAITSLGKVGEATIAKELKKLPKLPTVFTKGRGGSPTQLRTADDIAAAVTKGLLTPTELGKVNMVLFRDPNISTNIRKAALSDITSTGSFAKTMGKAKTEADAIRLLMDGPKKFTRGESVALVKAYQSKGGVLGGSRAVQQTSTTTGGKKGGKRTKEQANPKKVSGGETIWTKFKNRIRGLTFRNVAKILLAAGGLYLLWKWLTDDENGFYPTCLTNALSNEDLELLSTQGLDHIMLTETGNETIDRNGGGRFYSDKKFKTGNNKYEGKWDYNGSEIVVTVGNVDYTILCGDAAMTIDDGSDQGGMDQETDGQDNTNQDGSSTTTSKPGHVPSYIVGTDV
jgi:hypothetical protein